MVRSPQNDLGGGRPRRSAGREGVITNVEVLDMLTELRRRNQTAAASATEPATDNHKTDVLLRHRNLQRRGPDGAASQRCAATSATACRNR